MWVWETDRSNIRSCSDMDSTQPKNLLNVLRSENTKAGVHTAGVCSHCHYTGSIIYIVVCVLSVHLEELKWYPLGGTRSLFPCRQVTWMITHYQIWDVNLLQWRNYIYVSKLSLRLVHHRHGYRPVFLLASLHIAAYFPQGLCCILWTHAGSLWGCTHTTQWVISAYVLQPSCMVKSKYKTTAECQMCRADADVPLMYSVIFLLRVLSPLLYILSSFDYMLCN